MEGQQAAPVAEPGADQADTQAAEPLEAAAQEPVEPTAPALAADQSTAASQDRKVQQAEFTRATQAFGALKDQLDLPRTATREEVIAAVQALRERPADAEDTSEPDPLSERELAAEERAWQAEFRFQAAVYGVEPVTRVVEFIRLAREGNDIGEIMAAFQDAAAALNADGEGSEGEADEGAPDDLVVPAVGDIGLSEGDRGPSARPSTPTAPGGRRAGESGVVDHIRGIFQKAGGLGSPPA